MTVITVSRQYGSGGDEIASQVCDQLGYRLFHKGLIARAAAEAGLSAQDMLDYSEDNYKVKSFLERLFSRSAPIGQMRMWREDVSGVRTLEEAPIEEADVIALLQQAIRDACAADNIVIVGRGSQVLLKDCKHALHVRIVAPLEGRIQRVKQELKETTQEYTAAIDTRRQAQDLILKRDAASAGYLQRFYGIDWNDPTYYHLVLNTGMLSAEQSVRAVIDMARQLAPRDKLPLAD